MLTLAPVIILLTTVVEPTVQEPQPAPATFFIVRHADRSGAEDLLTDAGKKRANALRDFMAHQNIKAVYSTDTTRTQDTAKPTARKANLEIQSYVPKPRDPWYRSLMKKHEGQSVLIVGHSNTVVELVNGFGARMKYRIGEADFHSMFIVSVPSDGPPQAVRINYGPLAGSPAAAAEKKKGPATTNVPNPQAGGRAGDPTSEVIK